MEIKLTLGVQPRAMVGSKLEQYLPQIMVVKQIMEQCLIDD